MATENDKASTINIKPKYTDTHQKLLQKTPIKSGPLFCFQIINVPRCYTGQTLYNAAAQTIIVALEVLKITA